jgi:hypothetical protein
MIKLKNLLSEVLGPVRDDFDKSYNYQIRNGVWHTQKKGGSKWFSLANNKKAIDLLNKTYPTDFSRIDNSNLLPFKNNDEGNKFRKWVNDTYPEYAKQIDLDPEGSYNNSYIKKAWKSYGEEFMNSNSNVSALTPNWFQQIQVSPDEFMASPGTKGGYAKDMVTFKTGWVDIVDSTKSMKICNAPELKNQCASFVNVVDDSVSSMGDAWSNWWRKTGKVQSYNAMKYMSDNDKRMYEKRFQDSINDPTPTNNGGGNQKKNIKMLMQGILSNAPGPSPSDLSVGSHVGIFWPKSNYHQQALKVAGQKGIKDGKRVEYMPFNTHIGIVIAIKDGVPIILHEVDGIGYADPYDKIIDQGKVVWVKKEQQEEKKKGLFDLLLEPFLSNNKSNNLPINKA